MSDTLYRLIPEEGKHLADSHNTEGAVRGVYLDDETNKPCGAGEFIPISEDEENGIESDCLDDEIDFQSEALDGNAVAVAGILAVGIGIGIAAHKAFPYVKEWVVSTAVPGVKNLWNKLLGKKAKPQEQTDTAPEMIVPVKVEDFSNSIDLILNEYQKNMSSEEAQQHLLNILCAALYIANEIRQLSNTAIKDEERLEWREAFEKLTTKNVTDGINYILSAQTQKLKAEQLDQLSTLIGVSLIDNGIFIPIESYRVKEALNVYPLQERKELI